MCTTRGRCLQHARTRATGHRQRIHPIRGGKSSTSVGADAQEEVDGIEVSKFPFQEPVESATLIPVFCTLYMQSVFLQGQRYKLKPSLSYSLSGAFER